MIVTRLEGGLGNQLFQYAIGRRLALQRQQRLKLDISRYHDTVVTETTRAYRLHHLAIEADIATPSENQAFTDTRPVMRVQRKLTRTLNLHGGFITLNEQKNFSYDASVFEQRGHLRLIGFWQHRDYVAPIMDMLRREFAIVTPPTFINQAALNGIAAAPVSVSVHIRRGDYVSAPNASAVYGLLPLTYYERAAEKVLRHAPDAHFFVFSDDPAWAREHLRLPAPMRVFDHNDPDHDYDDLRLMIACQHHIIANSTFSAWAAWLSAHPEKRVYAPQRWFVRVPSATWLPQDWHLLPNE